MRIKEKIKKVYQKNGMGVEDKMIEHIINTPERLKGILRVYEREEIESMNYIFGKPEYNKTFTRTELELASKIDLFDRQIINAFRNIWHNRNKLKEGVANDSN